jgi:membrane-bound metal-dependent hydrolase YbcI (DUF457 family)
MASHHTHAGIGLLAGAVVATALHLDSAGMALFALSSGGAALLPDADTPDSAVTHAGGLLLAGPLWLFRRTAVEHRGLSHTLLACLGLSAGVYGLGRLFTTPHGWLPAYWPQRIVVPALLAMLAVRSVLTFGSPKGFRTIISRRHRFYLDALVGVSVGYLGATIGSSPHFATGLGLAVGAGFLSHLVVDSLFNGVPMFWPVPPSLRADRRLTIGRFKTGGISDHLLGWLCLISATYLFLRATPLAAALAHLLRHIHF